MTNLTTEVEAAASHLTEEAIEKALRSEKSASKAAKMLHVTRQAISKRISRSPFLQAAYNEARGLPVQLGINRNILAPGEAAEVSVEIDDGTLAMTYEPLPAPPEALEAVAAVNGSGNGHGLQNHGGGAWSVPREWALAHASESSELETLKRILGGGAGTDDRVDGLTERVDKLSKVVELDIAFGGNVVKRVDALESEIEAVKAASVQKIQIELKTAEGVRVSEEMLAHEKLPTILALASQGMHVMLVGPTASGKTTICEQVAEALGRTYYMTGAVLQKYELTGFISESNPATLRTPFRDAFEFGGVFLWDEIDASNPAALVAFNAALSNGHYAFPDGMVARHPDFLAIGAANTYGRGADQEYVGRTKLDAATLRRFAVVTMDYDEKLEAAMTASDEKSVAWLKDVQAWRKAVRELKIRHIIDPTMSMNGAIMLAAGMKRKEVEEVLVWKGLDAAQVRKIKAQ